MGLSHNTRTRNEPYVMSDYQSIIAHSVAVLAASWCMRHNFRYASVGFGLLLIDGVTGVLAECLDDSSLGDVHQFFEKCKGTLSLPLFATEACLFAGIKNNYAIINLLVPVYDLLSTYIMENSIDDNLMRFSAMCSLLCIAYTSFEKQQMFGYALTITEASMLPGIGIDRLSEDTPTRTLFGAIAAICCFHFLLDKQSLDI